MLPSSSMPNCEGRSRGRLFRSYGLFMVVLTSITKIILVIILSWTQILIYLSPILSVVAVCRGFPEAQRISPKKLEGTEESSFLVLYLTSWMYDFSISFFIYVMEITLAGSWTANSFPASFVDSYSLFFIISKEIPYLFFAFV